MADKAAERLGATAATLMERAGVAVAAAMRVRFSPRPVLVLCGAGNNGGDGYVVARTLAEAGWPVRVAALAAASGTAVGAAARWPGPVAAVTEALAGEDGTIIDALFGAGLSKPLTGVCAYLAEAFPAERVVAVDLPSGVPGDGRLIGPAFSAALTVTFARKKPAHVLYPARARCGVIVLADIGMPDAAIAEIGVRAWENQPDLWRDAFPWPSNQTHKHQRGSVGVASGGPLRTGAARLAARGALRAGAGLVTVLSPPNAALVNAAHLTAIMLETVADDAVLATRAAAFDAFVLGPAFGLGAATQRAALAAAGSRKALVLDADALTAFKDQPEKLFAVLHAQCLLTPHEGEFRRLFPDLCGESESKLERVRKAAARAGCPILLKGPDTVIAAPDGRAAVNTNAPSFLATAGAGDVLAGIAAGLAAQGMDMWSAGCAAVWLHAEAANAFGPGLVAEDLSEALPHALTALRRP